MASLVDSRVSGPLPHAHESRQGRGWRGRCVSHPVPGLARIAGVTRRPRSAASTTRWTPTTSTC